MALTRILPTENNWPPTAPVAVPLSNRPFDCATLISVAKPKATRPILLLAGFKILSRNSTKPPISPPGEFLDVNTEFSVPLITTSICTGLNGFEETFIGKLRVESSNGIPLPTDTKY